MDPLQIIATYSEPHSPVYTIPATRGRQVGRTALSVAASFPSLRLDLEFIERAALLHEIGFIGKVYGQDKMQRFLQWVDLFEN